MTVNVEYAVINDEDGSCELNHSALAALAWEFTNNWKRINSLNLEFTVSSQENVGDGLEIMFAFEALSVSQNDLNKFERKLNKQRFSPKLQSYLSDHQEGESNGGCFDFFLDDASSDSDGNETWSILEMLDFMNYGTTEYLVLILSGLVCCICTVMGCCIAVKRRSSKKLAEELSGLQTNDARTPENDSFQQTLYGMNNRKAMASFASGSTLSPPKHHETVPSDDEGIDI